MWWIRKLFQFFILFTLRLCRKKFRNVRRPNSHINYSPWRIVCPGEKPSYKFNNTGPVLGVVGGSYSSVSLQVEKLMIRNIQGKTNILFQVANLLRLFRIPQISPASTAKVSCVFLLRKRNSQAGIAFCSKLNRDSTQQWIIIMMNK